MQNRSTVRVIVSFLMLLCASQGWAAVAKTIPFRASIHALPQTAVKQMQGVTWKSGCPVALRQLAFVKMSYWGFDGKVHKGVMIVNKQLATEVVQIFEKLFEQKFPIQQMKPMYVFKGDDKKSMAANNTSSFNCRWITDKPGVYSKHAYGRAIDINPLQNPYIKGDEVLPEEGKLYINRSQSKPGMITRNSPVYHAFSLKGWYWGGDWRDRKDYQHFEVNNEIIKH